MSIHDLRNVAAGSQIETDVCLVGSGPAGWTIAEELRDSGLQVLILESGGLDPELDAEALNQIESVGLPLFNGRNRVMGGTSHTWFGRCVSFDDIDYESRPWVPLSGWPFGRETMAPYYDRASLHLGVCPDAPSPPGPVAAGIERPDVDPTLLRTIRYRFSHDAANPKEFMRFGPRFLSGRNGNLRILVHATVTHLNTDPLGSHIESVEVADAEGKRSTIRARAVVLCAGGVENARILLCSNRIVPCGIGNEHDVVGRYLMDHPRDVSMVVRFDTRDAAKVHAMFGPYSQNSAQGRQIFQHGMGLSPERQRREGLLNCSAWLDEARAADDPIDAAKRLAIGPRKMRDVAIAASQPGLLLTALQARLQGGRPVTHKLDRIGLLATCEQRPDPESRIWLSERRDRFGLPISKINWRVSAQEKATQAALAQTIAREFRRLGLPAAQLAEWVRDDRYEDTVFVDNCHPTSTTRIASDPRQGVVDANCQVHGVEQLFVAGSSVFPTNSHANPTLTIVALAVRLADHLREVSARPVRTQAQVTSAG